NKLSVYFTAGDAGAHGFSTPTLNVESGQWRHIAFAWDQTRGAALYVDGKRAAKYDGKWVYAGNVNQIGLGLTTRADYRCGTISFPQSYDELRVYDRWLEDSSIETLAKGDVPKVGPSNPQPLLDLR